MRSFVVVGLLAVFSLAGCVKDGKVGTTKIWETPSGTNQPKTIWKNDSGAKANAPTTIWQRSDGSKVIDLEGGSVSD